MKAEIWSRPEVPRPQVSAHRAGADSLGAIHSRLTTAGALAKLASLDGAELTRSCPNAITLLSDVAAAVACQKSGVSTQLFRLGHLSDLERKLVGDVLGEGEVAGIVALPDGSVAHIQEAALAGIWCLRFGAETAHQYIEVGAIPKIVRRAATDLTSTDLVIDAPPVGAMNARPVLAQIRERALVWREGMRAQVINFTLLPMSPVDMAFLQQSVGSGPIRLISRDYGTCRVQATDIRNVWSVQFFNSVDHIILDTLEVGGVPEIALAAAEDFEDSAERLQEIIEAYFE